jgi:hypothetical protein
VTKMPRMSLGPVDTSLAPPRARTYGKVAGSEEKTPAGNGAVPATPVAAPLPVTAPAVAGRA